MRIFFVIFSTCGESIAMEQVKMSTNLKCFKQKCSVRNCLSTRESVFMFSRNMQIFVAPKAAWEATLSQQDDYLRGAMFKLSQAWNWFRFHVWSDCTGLRYVSTEEEWCIYMRIKVISYSCNFLGCWIIQKDLLSTSFILYQIILFRFRLYLDLN